MMFDLFNSHYSEILDALYGDKKGNIPNIHPYGMTNAEVNRLNESKLRPNQFLRKRAPVIDEPTGGWPTEKLPDDLGLISWVRSVHKAVCGGKRGQVMTPGGFTQRDPVPKRSRSSDEQSSSTSGRTNNRLKEQSTSDRRGSNRVEVPEIIWTPSATHYQSLLTKVKNGYNFVST
jgi:hypothetical protein